MPSAITGDRQLIANLQFLDRYFGTQAMPITIAEQRSVANDIEAEAKRLAPVRTGELVSKIQVVHGDTSSEIVSGANHSQYVEFGTSKMAAIPFLRPAYHKYSYFTRVAKRNEEAIKNGLV